jgi:hypothetical protein
MKELMVRANGNQVVDGHEHPTSTFIIRIGDYVSCMFNNLLGGVKLNHVAMEQDFQYCTIFKLLSYTLGYACLSDVK